MRCGVDDGYTRPGPGQWRKDQEFAKSKGWIRGYTVFASYHARKDAPNVYLVTMTDRLPAGPEGEKRQQEYMAWRTARIAQMEKEAGDRAELRGLGSNLPPQELKLRN